MKRIFIPVLMFSLLTISCKNDKSTDKVDTTDTNYEVSEQEIDTSSNKIVSEPIPSEDVTNYDDMLDAYEAYIDKFIIVMKKMKKAEPDDMSILTEYTELMDKADEFSKQLESNEGQMSKAQLKRYIDLQTKFSKAAIDM
ncbi:DUF6591 domain-containing protein [Flavobacterium litorale]|uniref:DUF6591 domain-containing protein n=1 Tax=Flavobacterium litorale TaxID=2856519 RepID=A0ABX8V909_9FLAO|nr:DUF6591 domain-containing protein [Flavobacterium litorale]QYJ67678.1 hypothetical protein K1I41_08980 [Flavobacterium litorale]